MMTSLINTNITWRYLGDQVDVEAASFLHQLSVADLLPGWLRLAKSGRGGWLTCLWLLPLCLGDLCDWTKHLSVVRHYRRLPIIQSCDQLLHIMG